ncbi:hypothetical protein COJ37_17700 [Bacillus cereus]|nr:hypothetical protein CN356_04525 [Bacillus cereus]PFC49719.1 hypothetical protein CN297_20170 [Bacillus cereus]PFK49049.1 hypothetical protein COJ14_22505 [Bacillus cereus]PFL49850.1 hypothetical protein COJ33_22800 [Bacillus cereus]PFL99592.1 hypothetical protein COJ37_17700 [Bacillus cereus]
MVCNGGETISYVSSGFIFYLFLMRNLLIDFAFFYLLFNRIRMLAGLLFLVGIPPAFWKNPTLRAIQDFMWKIGRHRELL